ncbi:MAG TPA: GNAT family N-acetyltransferase [Cyclobacteriaceae bacterium]|nr:GNAT family N-acetyltransferase [Cyclobacteriaceae bacterium]
MKSVAETERLRLREFSRNDAPFLLELLNSPAWIKFIGDRNVRTIQEAQDYASSRLITSYHRFGFGLYKVELKDNSTPIGMCGLVRREALDDVDLGFAFLPEYTGMGYAEEAGSATIDLARKKVKSKRLVAITMVDNSNSINLLRKLGFNFEKTVNFPGEDQTLMMYSVDLKGR